MGTEERDTDPATAVPLDEASQTPLAAPADDDIIDIIETEASNWMETTTRPPTPGNGIDEALLRPYLQPIDSNESEEEQLRRSPTTRNEQATQLQLSPVCQP